MAGIYLGLENIKCFGCKMEQTAPIPVNGTEFEVQRLREKEKTSRFVLVCEGWIDEVWVCYCVI